MNRNEKKQLKDLLSEEGVEDRLLDVDIVRPGGPIGCLRTPDLRGQLERYLEPGG